VFWIQIRKSEINWPPASGSVENIQIYCTLFYKRLKFQKKIRYNLMIYLQPGTGTVLIWRTHCFNGFRITDLRIRIRKRIYGSEYNAWWIPSYHLYLTKSLHICWLKAPLKSYTSTIFYFFIFWIWLNASCPVYGSWTASKRKTRSRFTIKREKISLYSHKVRYTYYFTVQ